MKSVIFSMINAPESIPKWMFARCYTAIYNGIERNLTKISMIAHKNIVLLTFKETKRLMKDPVSAMDTNKLYDKVFFFCRGDLCLVWFDI